MTCTCQDYDPLCLHNHGGVDGFGDLVCSDCGASADCPHHGAGYAEYGPGDRVCPSCDRDDPRFTARYGLAARYGPGAYVCFRCMGDSHSNDHAYAEHLAEAQATEAWIDEKHVERGEPSIYGGPL